MNRFAQVGILLLLLYFGVREGVPFLLERFDLSSGAGTGSFEGATGEDTARECIDRVRESSSQVAEGLAGAGRRPGDRAGWDATRARLATSFDRASTSCFCVEPGCDRAAEALEELRDLVERFDRGVEDPSRMPLNAARDLQRVEDLLDRASRSNGF